MGHHDGRRPFWKRREASTAGGAENEEPPAKTPRAKTVFEISLAAALVTKKAFLDAKGKAQQMLENMASDPTYVKEKDSCETELKGLAKSMNEAQHKKVFYRDFCLKEVADMKSRYATSVLHSELDAFTEDLTKPIRAVEKNLKEILAVSRTRLLVTAGAKEKPTAAKKKGKRGHVSKHRPVQRNAVK